MRALKEFLGSPCPVCKQDILQRPPERARMPVSADLAFCPGCESELNADELNRLTRPGLGFFARLARPRRTEG